MLQKYLVVIPFFAEHISDDFNFRYAIVDHLEENNLAEVIEEGTGEHEMHIFFESELKKEELESIIEEITKIHKVPLFTLEKTS